MKKRQESCHVATSSPASSPLSSPASSPLSSPAPSPLADIRIEEIHPSDFNPRRTFDQAAHLELTESVKKYGVLQPLVVRPVPGWLGRFEIVAGERRWRAACAAGLTQLPCVVRHLSDSDALKIALIENLQRKDMNPVDAGEGLQRLKDQGLKQGEIARLIDRDPSYVSALLSILNLPADVREMMAAGYIDQGHGRTLLKWKAYPAVASALALRACKENWTVRQLESGWDYNTIRVLNDAGAIAEISGMAIGDAALKTCQTACPFKAYHKSSHYYGLCLNPAHYQELKAAHVRREADRRAEALAKAEEFKRRRAEAEAVVLSVIENDGSEISKETAPIIGAAASSVDLTRPHDSETATAAPIPRLRDLSWNDYAEIQGKDIPGCSEECACRSFALNNQGLAVPICLNKPRRYSLQEAELKRSETERAARVESRFLPAAEALIDDSHFAAALAGFTALTHITKAAVVQAATDLGITGIDFCWVSPNGYPTDGTDKKAAIEQLMTLDLDVILDLAARSILEQERQKAAKFESHGTYFATYICKRFGLSFSEASDTPAPVSLPAPEETHVPAASSAPKTASCSECAQPVDLAILEECGTRVPGGLEFLNGVTLLDPIDDSQMLVVCPTCAKEGAPEREQAARNAVAAGVLAGTLCKSCGIKVPVSDGVCGDCGPDGWCPDCGYGIAEPDGPCIACQRSADHRRAA